MDSTLTIGCGLGKQIWRIEAGLRTKLRLKRTEAAGGRRLVRVCHERGEGREKHFELPAGILSVTSDNDRLSPPQ